VYESTYDGSRSGKWRPPGNLRVSVRVRVRTVGSQHFHNHRDDNLRALRESLRKDTGLRYYSLLFMYVAHARIARMLQDIMLIKKGVLMQLIG